MILHHSRKANAVSKCTSEIESARRRKSTSPFTASSFNCRERKKEPFVFHDLTRQDRQRGKDLQSIGNEKSISITDSSVVKTRRSDRSLDNNWNKDRGARRASASGSFESPAGSPAFSKMAAAVLPPPLVLPRAISLFLSLSLSCMHIYSFSLSHTFSRSLFLSHTHAFARRRACKVSRMRATRTRACPPLSQKHPLRFTLYEGTPSSFSTSTVTSSSSSSCSACCLLFLPSLSDRLLLPDRVTKEPREKTANMVWTMDCFPSSLLCEDPFSGWRWDQPSLFEDTFFSVPNSLAISEDEDKFCFRLVSVVEKQRIHFGIC